MRATLPLAPMTFRLWRLAPLFLLATFLTGCAAADRIADRAGNAAERAVNRNVDRRTDRAVTGAIDARPPRGVRTCDAAELRPGCRGNPG